MKASGLRLPYRSRDSITDFSAFWRCLAGLRSIFCFATSKIHMHILPQPLYLAASAGVCRSCTEDQTTVSGPYATLDPTSDPTYDPHVSIEMRKSLVSSVRTTTTEILCFTLTSC